METNDKTMSNNKQSSSIDWLWEIAYNRELTAEAWKQAKAMHKEEVEASYADGYSEGYNRALELVKWKIDNELKQDNEQQ